MSTTCEKKIDTKNKFWSTIDNLKEFTTEACKITNYCVKIIFKACNITKKYSILYCKAINEEIIKDLILQKDM